MLEIYKLENGETVDPEKEFPDHGVVIGLDGEIKLTYYGSIVASVERGVYGIRVNIEEK